MDVLVLLSHGRTTQIKMPTNHILLIGAGFTHNWGGWLASELIGDLLGRVAHRPDVHRVLRESNGFEGALGRLQHEHLTSPDDTQAAGRLRILQDAIRGSFRSMNQALWANRGMEFFGGGLDSVHQFLWKFDAIFSLNQDLMLEFHYEPRIPDGDPRSGFHFPGMKPADDTAPKLYQQWVASDYDDREDLQPIYKLHGSSNWLDEAGGELLVMGNNKLAAIAQNRVIGLNFNAFTRQLAQKDTRLMVIGYGFQDDHINEAICDAGEAGLQLFIVDPAGTGVFKNLPLGYMNAPKHAVGNVYLVGESRRPLSTTFGRDELERSKLLRFFEAPTT